jgi:hypothetical protein
MKRVITFASRPAVVHRDEFVEVFELAAPGKGLKLYSESRFYRMRLE